MVQAVIVGAGPAGVTTALLLARAGLEVTLIERETALDRVFRGEGLMPSGVDALLQMGLRSVLESVPSRLIETWNVYLDGEAALVIPEPIAETGDRAMRVISPAAFLERVIAAAERYPTFHYRLGVRVRGLKRTGDGRVTGVQTETVDAARQAGEVAADLVIGGDGRGSIVRTLAGLELELQPEQSDVIWFKLPAPTTLQDRGAMIIMVAARKPAAICYTSWDGCLQYGLILPKGQARRVAAGNWLEAAVQPAPVWLADHLRARRAEIAGPTRLNVLVGRSPVWTVPGLILLGDAAHPMSPVRAQGINLALRDAIVAANHLIPALRSGSPAVIDAATRAVQAEREPEIVRAQLLQVREAQGEQEARAGSWKYSLAKRLAPVMGRWRWAQRAWLQRQHGLRFGVTEVRLHDSVGRRE